MFYEYQVAINDLKYFERRCVSDNPYDEGTELWLAWNMGYFRILDRDDNHFYVK